MVPALPHGTIFSIAWNSKLDPKLNFMYTHRENPMDTSLLICHWFDVKISRGKFLDISSILKDESMRKLCHQFDVEISTWIRLSKLTKYRWVLYVDFSISFRRRIDVTAVLVVSISSQHFNVGSISNLETTLKQRWYNFISTLFQHGANVSKRYIKTSRASDKDRFVNR